MAISSRRSSPLNSCTGVHSIHQIDSTHASITDKVPLTSTVSYWTIYAIIAALPGEYLGQKIYHLACPARFRLYIFCHGQDSVIYSIVCQTRNSNGACFSKKTFWNNGCGPYIFHGDGGKEKLEWTLRGTYFTASDVAPVSSYWPLSYRAVAHSTSPQSVIYSLDLKVLCL